MSRKAYLPPVDAHPDEIARALFDPSPSTRKGKRSKLKKGQPDNPTTRQPDNPN